MSYFAELKQNVVVSAGNSSTDALDAGATFTGPSTIGAGAQSTLGVAGIQVNLFTNQNCLVHVDQSMDGSNWDIGDPINYYASRGGQSWTEQATAAYTRVRVTNLNAAAAATPFRLQTALCPIVEAVPRSLSPEGNFKVGVYEIEGDFETNVAVSPMHALRTAEAIRLVGTAFGSAFDTNFWARTTNTGSSSSTVANDVLTLATNPGAGAGSGNSAIVNSVRIGRYVAGKSNYCRMQMRTPTVTGANTRRWGVFDVNDGYFFEWDGTTFKIVSRKGGVDTAVASGSFNGKQGSTFVPTANVTTYEITWTNKSVWFSVNDVILHKLTATTARLTNTNHFKIGFECTNGANTNNNTLECWVASINRNGNLLTQPQVGYISTIGTTTLKIGPGNLHTFILGTIPTTTGTITVYDNTSATGTVLYRATISKATQASNVPVSVDFKGLAFSVGLTIVIANAAPDLTVVYE